MRGFERRRRVIILAVATASQALEVVLKQDLIVREWGLAD